jgi:lipoprotein-releasing system permease protein
VSDAAPAIEGWLAWRYLATRQREGFVSFIAMFSLVGVALGVAALIVVLSVMGGFRQQLVGRILGMNGHVVVTGKDGLLKADAALLARLKAVPEIKTVRLTLERQGLVTGNGQGSGQTRGASLRGVRTEDLLSREVVISSIVAGDPGAFALRGGVVMGDRLRQALGARAGDIVTLVTHGLNESGTIAPRYVDYELLASFHTKRYEFDATLVFMPLELLQEDLEVGPDMVTSVDIEIADPAQAPAIADKVRAALARDDLRVGHWLGLNARFVGALQVERVMMFIILTLIIAVAALNVVASFTMLVRVKRGSIAILRTMGAGRGTIIRAFFMAAAAVGVVGTALGAALGLLICANLPAIGQLISSLSGGHPGVRAPEVDFIVNLPVRVQAAEVILIVAVAFVLSLVAAAYPAWRTTRVEPVEALRNE